MISKFEEFRKRTNINKKYTLLANDSPRLALAEKILYNILRFSFTLNFSYCTRLLLPVAAGSPARLVHPRALPSVYSRHLFAGGEEFPVASFSLKKLTISPKGCQSVCSKSFFGRDMQ